MTHQFAKLFEFDNDQLLVEKGWINEEIIQFRTKDRFKSLLFNTSELRDATTPPSTRRQQGRFIKV